MKNRTPAERRSRISSIDVVRGAAMVFMALDHVRDFVTELRFQPEDLARGSAALFATRWVTHFCAPAFFLLAGVGIGISRLRGASAGAQSRYLLVRGLWLLVLELIITPIGWQFGFDLIPAFALVLWALGWSMIVMAVAVHLPVGVVAALAVVTIGCHNLLDPLQPQSFGWLAGLWHALHVPGFFIPNVLFVGYPLVPWIGVMALGYALADVYEWTPGRRRKFLVMAGAAAVVAFIALRAVNGYGNTFPWSEQRTPALTVASFLNLRKYPPSLQFLLMTLGPDADLPGARRARARWIRQLSQRVRPRPSLLLCGAHLRCARRRHAPRVCAGWRVAPDSNHQRPTIDPGLVRRLVARRLRRLGDRRPPLVLPVSTVFAVEGDTNRLVVAVSVTGPRYQRVLRP